MLRLYFSCLAIVISLFSFSQSKSFKKQLDSIQKLRTLSKNDSFSIEERKEYAINAVNLSKKTKVDSVIILSNRNLAFLYVNIDYYDTFKDINLETIDLASKIKDSISIAYSYHNLGWYYQLEEKPDSAYYYYNNVRKLYNKFNDDRNEGEVLLNMAYIQKAEKDYVGAETNLFEALKLIENEPKTDHNLDTLFTITLNLASVFEELEDYSKSIEYYNKALEYVRDFEDYDYYEEYVDTNKALIYLQIDEFEKAEEIYSRLLTKENIKAEFPEDYCIYLNNLAIAKYKFGNNYSVSEIEMHFYEALQLATQIDNKNLISGISLDKAEFYIKNKREEDARSLLDVGLETANEINNNDFKLKALKLKSQIEEGAISNKYLEDYIKLSDSLMKKERAIRNKFARIEFETDEILAEKEKISKERLIFLLSSIGLTLLLILIYVVISQRAKNNELKFAQKQQEANEEIYNLMIKQQDKIEEGRANEKKRISQELHDGILGKLFGVRLNLDSLNFIKTDDAVQNRAQYISELKTIETEIRKISHDLNTDFIGKSSFIDIITALIDKQSEVYQFTYEFDNDQDINWEKISNKHKIHVYRIIQECLQNIYKHAEANHVKIGFELKKDVILVTIDDNGRGFNVNKAKRGIGLKNIDARVREFKGRAEVFSKENVGTSIKIKLPT